MSPLDEEYPVVITQALIWGDMDAYQHINNTVYFRYFEDVRIAYFEKTGVIKYKDQHHIGPILARTDCNFKRPLAFPDTIFIGAKAEILSEKKFSMEYAVFSKNLDTLVADGSGLVVFYDYKAGKSCQIPSEIVGAMNAL